MSRVFAVLALTLFIAFALLDGVVRAWIQRRRTGDTGVRRPATGVQWASRLTFAAGILLTGLLAPVADLLGTPVLGAFDHGWLRTAGVVLTAAGLLATFAAQLDMGASWRTTADPRERPDLVTTGVFGVVRNPIYSMVTLMVAGLTLTVPSVIALAGLAANILGTELQVRLIEEPYLRRILGQAYQHYAARVGRFLPGIGRART